VRAQGTPRAALDHLFADLAANGVWDDATDESIWLLT
jgi:hypothetical protein